jgi:5'-3' exonuclease
LKKRVAIVDGDVLCYQAFVSRVPPGTVLGFDENMEEIVQRDYTPQENADFLKQGWKNLKSQLVEIVESAYCSEYLMAVKSDTNYRDDIFSEYKKGRPNHRPSDLSKFVPTLRKLMVKEDMAVEAVGREADDLMRIWARESTEHGIDFVICSIDKDLRCIPGKHYHMKEKALYSVSPEEGLRLYYEQLLKGDPVDNIPGLPGVGPKKAEKALADCKTVEDFQETVIGEYIAVYGDDWANYLLCNGKLIHLQKHLYDYFDLRDWSIAVELGVASAPI